MAATRETVSKGGRCARGAPARRYDVAAVAVDITLNRYLDHDPHGRMYVLESDLPRVQAEQARNDAARHGRGEPAVSLGLQGDAIQPLTLRVRPGECLRIRLRNGLPGSEPVSLHLHGSSLLVAGRPAIATNRRATIRPGRRVTYEWMVPGDEPEGTHYFHSHGDERAQTSHGLFGAVIVEPRGSTWFDPRSGHPTETGWDAIVHDPEGGHDFREFALYYHEVGNENYQLLDVHGEFVPLVDPITFAYRPDGLALNYRSEPFMNRLALEKQLLGRVDFSLEYSSYAFGDPATPMMRSYLGDPVKQRVVHAGSELFHVHHVHGGGVRWRLQPGVEDTGFASGLDKHPRLRPRASERTDSQSIGPSETFDIADECGAGGCQQSVGDFMYHCHVVHHYFAGMWGIWRVYNTLQDGRESTDSLPPMLELPDRPGSVAPAVPSQALEGSTVDWYGNDLTIGPGRLASWVEPQLPPAGVPRGYDASVLDWRKDGNRYLSEPETTAAWPGYRSPAPGARLPIVFDPRTGKPAYPFLRPHLAQRPPFPPDHEPAPFLDPFHQGTDPPVPGGNGPGSLCPGGSRSKPFAIDAVPVPIVVNKKDDIVDSQGELFVLRHDVDAVASDPSRRVPLTIRADAGEDCVDVLLRSELTDNAGDPFSKVGIHIHFVQFDVQASDGVDTGFNYEQTVRPFRVAGSSMTAPAPAGATSVLLGGGGRLQPGVVVGVGIDRDQTFETARVTAVEGDKVTFDAPLAHAHDAGEIVSTEFARYRWYPDVQFGSAFFHDHTNVLYSGQHGLFGALISEPPHATYHDPHTGAELDSGPVADIHADAPVSVDVSGSFREIGMFIQDENPLVHIGRSTGGGYNLRAEPLDQRGRDPARLFSTPDNGDPATPVLDAYLGDPIVVRSLVAAQNEVHTWHVDGHWFRAEPWSRASPPVSTIHLGISERRDLVIPRAGGPQRMPGDYLYYSGRELKLQEGSWGILRVHAGSDPVQLEKLPGHETIPSAATTVCPAGAPVRRYDVDAVEVPLPMLGGGKGKVYVLDTDRALVVAGRRPPQPLVLHVDVGDCVRVKLRNDTRGGPVSFHADQLAFDPRTSGGVAAGYDPPQSVAPGGTRSYTYYASPEVGQTTALVRDWGDVLHNPGLGLYGAVVVGPRGATYRDPATGRDLAGRSSWRADVVPANGLPYRDFSLFFQDQDEGIGNHHMPYTTSVEGVVGLNYQTAPFATRLTKVPDPGRVYSRAAHGDPPTPLPTAYVADRVRIHVLAPWSEQAQVFSLEGHEWPVEPGVRGTTRVSSVQVGGLEAITIEPVGGAGGPARLAGDYLYGDHRMPYLEAGLWGVFRVRPQCAVARGLHRLPGDHPTCGRRHRGPAAFGPVVGIGAMVVGVTLAWRRRRERVT